MFLQEDLYKHFKTLIDKDYREILTNSFKRDKNLIFFVIMFVYPTIPSKINGRISRVPTI